VAAAAGEVRLLGGLVREPGTPGGILPPAVAQTQPFSDACLAVSAGVFRRTHNLGSKNAVEFRKVLLCSETGSLTGRNKSKLKTLGFSEGCFLLRM